MDLEDNGLCVANNTSVPLLIDKIIKSLVEKGILLSVATGA